MNSSDETRGDMDESVQYPDEMVRIAHGEPGLLGTLKKLEER